MRLRDVRMDDVPAYVRMRCDPVMMAELGGPQPRDGIPDKVRKDVADAEAGTSWIKMILMDEPEPDSVAGTVSLWSHEDGDAMISEIGWMVLPEHQGRGLATAAVRELLTEAAADGRWGRVYAFPAVTNAPSNGICRSLGFHLERERDILFAGSTFRVNAWVIDPAEA